MEDVKNKFEGKWKLQKNENIDAFFSDVGVNFVLRKIIGAAPVTQTITVEGETITIETDAGFRKRSETVTLNKEEDKTTEDGQEGKMLATYEDGKLKFKQTPNDNTKTTTTLTRERKDDELILTMTRHKNPEIVAKRYFNKIS